MRGRHVQQHVLNVLTEYRRQNGGGDLSEIEIAIRIAAVIPPEVATRTFRARNPVAVARTTLFDQVRTGYILLAHFALIGLRAHKMAERTAGERDVRRPDEGAGVARTTVRTAAASRRWRLVLDPTEAANDRAWADALARAGVDAVGGAGNPAESGREGA